MTFLYLSIYLYIHIYLYQSIFLSISPSLYLYIYLYLYLFKNMPKINSIKINSLPPILLLPSLNLLDLLPQNIRQHPCIPTILHLLLIFPITLTLDTIIHCFILCFSTLLASCFFQVSDFLGNLYPFLKVFFVLVDCALLCL